MGQISALMGASGVAGASAPRKWQTRGRSRRRDYEWKHEVPGVMPIDEQGFPRTNSRSSHLLATTREAPRQAVLDGVICSDWFSRPDHPGGPGFGRSAPEWIGRGQAQWKKRGRTQIQAAGRYVRFRDGGLMSEEPDRQPSLLVEDPRRIHHLSHDGRQRGTHLRGDKRPGKRSAQCDFCEQMEGAEAITERTPDGREASIRPDESFLNRGVPLRSGRHRRPEGLPFPGGLCDGVEDIQLHGMDDEAVVVVPVE